MAAVSNKLTLGPGQREAVPTGLILEIPEGYEGQVRPRSGLASKFGITLANSIGTIDSDYRHEVFVLLINLSDSPYEISPGERIAQLVLAPIQKVEIIEVNEVTPDSERTGGFGSTGKFGIGESRGIGDD